MPVFLFHQITDYKSIIWSSTKNPKRGSVYAATAKNNGDKKEMQGWILNWTQVEVLKRIKVFHVTTTIFNDGN